jgi:hypothetical protein
MTTSTRTDWHAIAAMDDAQRAAWITEHGRHSEEGARREWMGDFVEGSLELEDANRTRMMGSLLNSLLTMDDAEARSYASDFQRVLDHGTGAAAFSAIQSLHTGARTLSVEDTTRLGHVWPRVFGKDLAASH